MKKIAILGSLLLFILIANTALAQSFSTEKPFGGQVSRVQICTCDATYMMTINNEANNSVTESFIYSPFSTELYRNYMFMFSGIYILGTADLMTTECKIISGSSCTPVGFGYPIKMMGTSLMF